MSTDNGKKSSRIKRGKGLRVRIYPTPRQQRLLLPMMHARHVIRNWVCDIFNRSAARAAGNEVSANGLAIDCTENGVCAAVRDLRRLPEYKWLQTTPQVLKPVGRGTWNMILRYLKAATLGCAMLATTTVESGDADAGRAKAAICTACHGANGNSVNPMWPKLAGQHAAYLAKQLRAFRSGERKEPLMSPMAMPLSDVDIEDLSAFFENQAQK